ncbi:MAG: hypothetical protein RMM28_03400 [Thermoleophilia bacterium]|nr:hypothetical protein [Gaiellaceae bacterium]MDW8338167.1 hypothetical protein [Thermoleophilia bacterium]
MRATFLALAIAIATAGCGTVENEPNLSAALEQTEASPTVRFEISSATVFDDDTSSMVCVGGLDRAREAARIECEWGADSRFELVSIGATTYVRYQGELIGELPAGKVWVKVPTEAGPLDEFRPDAILGTLRQASGETERVGREDVRGVETVRYRVMVTCAGARLACDGVVPVDVWIDDGGLLRRIQIDDDIGEGTIEFFDFGAEVEIEAPPDDKVVDDSSLDTSVPEQSCAGSAAPISVERAASALRRAGFDVQRETQACGPRVAAMLSDFDTSDPGGPVLSCYVFESPTTASGLITVVGSRVQQIRRRLENVDCSLTVTGRSDPAVDRLDDALAELSHGP